MKTTRDPQTGIRLTRRERIILTQLLRRGRTGLWIATRARAVVLAATDQTVSGIAWLVGRDRKWVRHWLHRFAQARLAGLQDARPSFPPEERHEVLALACHPLAELAAARTHWALRPLAEAVYTWGSLHARISWSTVGRWLRQAALKPHRVRRWLHSPDPEFRRKVRRIVRFYLHPPRRSRIICVDEKTQVQILEHFHPGRPPAPGRPQRLDAHYRRHDGTLAIFAGLDVRTGQVVVKVRRRRPHHEFLELLKALRTRWPRGTLILVLDNLSIHTTPEVQMWLHEQAGGVRLDFLPLHASWLNQMEL